MSKDRSEKDILDELRHEGIIEHEERIRQEYPRLVEENKKLKDRVADLERYRKSWDKELQNARDAAAEMARELDSLRRRLSTGQVAVAPPKKLVAGVCRDCHERILWGTTRAGKNIPLQPKSIVGEMIDWNRELEAELTARGIQVRRGYDELGDQVTIAVTQTPNPLLARVIYPVHFSSCTARNLSSFGG